MGLKRLFCPSFSIVGTSRFSFVGTNQFSHGLVPALGGGLCFPNKDCLGKLKGELPPWLTIPCGEAAGLSVNRCGFLACYAFPVVCGLFPALEKPPDSHLLPYLDCGPGNLPCWGLWNTQPTISHSMSLLDAYGCLF